MPRNARTCAKPLTIDLSESARKRTGDIFGVLKAEASEKNCDALAAHIEDALVRGIFESLRKLPLDTPQETILEATVAKVNDALFRLLGEDGLSLGPETISGAVISQRGKDISAAVWGRPSILLFHPSGDGQVHIYDLVDDENAENRSGRGFSQMISGRITGRDRLLVGSDDLRNPLGDAVLAELVLREDPKTAIAGLRQSLAGSRLSFALSVFVSDGVEMPLERQSADRGPCLPKTKAGAKMAKTEQSIDRLIATESQTSEIMSPPVLPAIGKKALSGLKALAGWLPDRLSRWKREKEEAAVIAGQQSAKSQKRDDTDDTEPTAGTDGKGGDGGDKADRNGTQPPETGKNRVADRAIRPTIGETAGVWLTDLMGAINDLPKPGRIGMVAMLAILATINFSSLAIGWQKSRQELAMTRKDNLNQIEQKIDSAEASLIYHDNRRANEILDQAESLIALLSEKSGDQQREKQALISLLREKREVANLSFRLSAPDVIASLNGKSGPLQLNRLAEMDNRIFAAAGNGQIFEIDRNGGARETASSPGQPAIFLADEHHLLSSTNEGKLLAISPTGQSTSGTISWGTESVDPQDAVVWGSRLYVLDATHNRLLRHSALADGYGSPQFYLKDGTDVSGGVSLAVDGNLYVLNGNGQVTKLRLGERQDFGLIRVEPPLTDAKRIRTGEDDKNLWILDSDGRRLLSFDKETGELQGQYLNDSFADTGDFLVDETSRQIIVAKDNDILRFTLPE